MKRGYIGKKKTNKIEGLEYLFPTHSKISAIHIYFQRNFVLQSQNMKVNDSIRILN